MFGRTVDIDGTEVFIICTPDTPYSEILMRAAAILRKEEHEEALAASRLRYLQTAE